MSLLRLVALVAAAVSVASTAVPDYRSKFAEFKLRFGKQYATAAEEAARYSITSLKAELNLRKISAAVPRGINGDAAKAALAARLVALWALTREGADVSATAMPELPAREVCRRCPHRLLLGLSRN